MTRGDARERDELVGRGVDPWVVLEAARETERAGRHLAVEQRSHVLHLGGRRLSLEVVSHDHVAQPAVTHVGRDVHGRRSLLHASEPIGEREARPSVLTDDDGRDALAHGAECAALGGEAAVMMAVCVDETGSEDEATSVN